MKVNNLGRGWRIFSPVKVGEMAPRNGGFGSRNKTELWLERYASC